MTNNTNYPKIEIIRTEINSEPRKLNIGWTCHELTDEDLDRIDSPENLASLKLARESKEIANSLITHHAKDPPKRANTSYTSISVLQPLWGTPWNDAAANFLQTLRPSCVRVTTGEVTSDAITWRVTVFLEEDESTIKSIKQEVEVGLNGFRNGQDASNYLNKNYEALEKPQGRMIINTKAIRRARKEENL